MEPGAPDSDQPTGRRWRKRLGARMSLKTGAVVAARVIAAGLSILIVVGSGFAWASYSSFVGGIPRVTIVPPRGSKAVANIDGADQNILIVGNDDRSGYTPAQLKELGTQQDGGSQNTDTMMLLHVPANGSQATVISFPRDSYVAIPAHGMDKLNSAYTYGLNDSHGNKGAAASLLEQTIENLTGLSIDHYVQVNLLGFYDISKAVGGVTVCLNHSMRPAKTTNDVGFGFDSGYENGKFTYSYSGINLPKGISHIEGTQAIAFVRQRHGLTSDLDRIKRQQYFLAALFRKEESAGVLLQPLKLASLFNAVRKSLILDTDLNPLKLLQQLQNLTAGNVKFTTIPLAGDNPTSPVGDVELVETTAMPNFIDALIGQDPAVALKTATVVPAASFTVDVLNASGVSLRASKNTAALVAAGFKAAIGAGDPAPLAASTIEYPKGMEGAAKTLADQVPGVKLLRSIAVTKVTLVLGQDNVQVKSLMPAPVPGKKPATTPAAATNAPVVMTAAQGGCIN